MRIRVDLHTHTLEATGDSIPRVETVKKIIAQVKKHGLAGIAVTEHGNKDYGFRVKEIADRYFPHEKVMIIAGQEIRLHNEHVVELYLRDRVFRFCAHPFFGNGFDDFLDKEGGNIHGIELKNGAWQLQEDRVREVAERHNLFLLENSDAHSLKDMGFHYNEIDLEDLYHRCGVTTQVDRL